MQVQRNHFKRGPVKFLSSVFLTCAVVVMGARPGVGLNLGRVLTAVDPTVSSPQNSAQDGIEASNLSGIWQVSFNGKRGGRQATMQLKEDGTKLSGSFQGERGSAPLKGTLNGNQVSFTVKMPRRTLSFSGSVEGDKMSGTTEQGGSWSASRQ